MPKKIENKRKSPLKREGMPIKACFIKEGLSANNMMLMNLNMLGLLKRYYNQHGYYTQESYDRVKKFADEYREEFGVFPKLEAYRALKGRG